MIGGVEGNRRENIHTYNFAYKYFENDNQQRNILFICENNPLCNPSNFLKGITSLICALKVYTGKIYPNHALLRSYHRTLYYPCITPANIPYARATLSLSENLHLQKEVLLIHNNSFYIHKLFLV